MKLSHISLILIAAGLVAGCATETPEPVPAAASESAPTGLGNGAFTVELNGFPIHYEIHGQGPVLMTVPNSWGLSHQGLRTQYRPLEEHLTLVYFDPRGMGESGPVREDTDMSAATIRADFDALRRHLGLEKVHVIGWSNGGQNLFFLASEQPEAFHSAIFLDCSAYNSEEDGKAQIEKYPEAWQRWTAFQEEMTDDIPAEEANARIKQLYLEAYPMFDHDPGRLDYEEIFKDTSFSWRHSQYSEVDWPEFDERDRLARIPMRSLVVVGGYDTVPVEKAREIDAGLPDSRLVVLEESGHFPALEEPEAFAAAIFEFLEVGP